MAWLEGPLVRAGRHLMRRPLRTRLGRMATRYAAHGWDVLPGAYLRGRRFDCGRPWCQTVGCHPAVDDWESAAGHDATTVAAWWQEMPYTVLLATGRAFDVLEVPATLGGPAVRGLSPAAIGGPVAIAPGGRWMFLVRPGAALTTALAARADVVLHGMGSWVPAPPTRQPDGPVRWRLSPRAVGFAGADPDVVQALVVAALPRTMVYRPQWLSAPGQAPRATAGGTATANGHDTGNAAPGNALPDRGAQDHGAQDYGAQDYGAQDYGAPARDVEDRSAQERLADRGVQTNMGHRGYRARRRQAVAYGRK
jgi:Bifunctional DNA primase/polymerase, N-terminal